MNLTNTGNTCNNLTLTRPVINNKITTYGRILICAYNSTETFTKKDLLIEALPEKFENGEFKTLPVSENGFDYTPNFPGYFSNYFSIFNINDLVSYNPKSRKLEKGINLSEYVETYLKDFI